MIGFSTRDKKSNEWIRQRTKVTDVARTRDRRWNIRIQEWRSWSGKGNRGRPLKRWIRLREAYIQYGVQTGERIMRP